MEKVLIRILIIVLLPSAAFCQFGRNKLQTGNPDWYEWDTEHFELYYHSGYDSLASIGKGYLDRGYDYLTNSLGRSPDYPLPVIIYPSPNEFLENNVSPEILTEATGGFTEIFKNRVVIPFNGNYRDFSHVLRHELVHTFQFYFLFGGNISSIASTSRFITPPLWFIEGMAEYLSLDWDFESDMYIRDAVVHDYLLPPDEIGGFLIYKQGQSMVKYIAERYGVRKLGEILSKMKLSPSIDDAFEDAVGRDQEKLYEEWSREIKGHIWEELPGREFADDFATRITDHKREGSHFNIQPVFSPDGNYIAYFSDESDYSDLMLISVLSKKRRHLVKGERSGDFEGFHSFSSAPAFSPDGKRIAYVTRHKTEDYIAIFDIDRKKVVEEICPKLKALYSPAFFPDGKQLIFSGLSGTKLDLYTYDLENGRFSCITDDIYPDNEPSVSPDGKFVAFTSARPLDAADTSSLDKLEENIFIYDVEGDSIFPVTYDGFSSCDPSWGPNGRLVYSSYRNGISNLYLYDMAEGVSLPLTDVVTGAFFPSFNPDGGSVAFSTFQDGGWDIFILDNLSPKDTIADTPFRMGKPVFVLPVVREEKKDTMKTEGISEGFSKFVFAKEPETEKKEARKLGKKRYTPRFSADYATASLFYDTFYGIQGQTILLFSDMLGNHRVFLATDLFNTTDNASFYLSYAYLKRRTDIGGTIFHTKNYFIDNDGRLFSDRLYGTELYVSYPFSQFVRAEMDIAGLLLNRYFYDPPFDDKNVSCAVARVAWVKDNSLWGSTGPINGTRIRFKLEGSPPLSSSSYDYIEVQGDARRYIRVSHRYTFAMRLTGGVVTGGNPKSYYLGGASQWLNYRIATDDIYSVRDMYLSNYIYPLRGYELFDLFGTRYALFNFEFRYPFIERLSLGFPPIEIRNINGAIFADVGSAWDNDSDFKPVMNSRLKDIKAGIGVGVRVNLGILLLNWDTAWSTNLVDIAAHPIYYFTLGVEY
ncbi:MAG: hypothetical protein B6D65_00845 [candidate division Zixibacteria bacterium 4484_93]|nr:MAG: hypothetical protein B6D65_00845 [candidate division Zixibacteria bacterium 4484_93]